MEQNSHKKPQILYYRKIMKYNLFFLWQNALRNSLWFFILIEKKLVSEKIFQPKITTKKLCPRVKMVMKTSKIWEFQQNTNRMLNQTRHILFIVTFDEKDCSDFDLDIKKSNVRSNVRNQLWKIQIQKPTRWKNKLKMYKQIINHKNGIAAIW